MRKKLKVNNFALESKKLINLRHDNGAQKNKQTA